MTLDVPTDNKSELVKRDTPEKVWWLYLIATRTGSLYCGITLDVQRRFAEHQGPVTFPDSNLGAFQKAQAYKGARFLRGKGPLQLRFNAIAGTRSDALKAECKVKKLTRAKKDDLIAGDKRLLAQLGLSIVELS
jgi:putative endonuclease